MLIKPSAACARYRLRITKAGMVGVDVIETRNRGRGRAEDPASQTSYSRQNEKGPARSLSEVWAVFAIHADLCPSPCYPCCSRVFGARRAVIERHARQRNHARERR